jgi:molybdenum cofactor biosynthesis enzyme MoaA
VNNYCALPFAHVNVRTDGFYQICCYHENDHGINISQHDHNQWSSSKYVDQVREAFQQDQRHLGCAACWHREDQGHSSMRERTRKEYQILGHKEFDTKIVNVEIQVGNLCNLKCIMCNEHESSAFLAENTQLGIATSTQSQYRWSQHAFENLTKLLDAGPRVLNIRGGEPFYNKDLLRICQNLSLNVCQRTLLHITTNATVWNQEWHDVLAKFKLVRIMFSVDATEDLFEYIRFPADWTTVDRNISAICKLANVNPVIHCVAQNLNISSISSVIKYAKSKGIFLQLDLLTKPDFLQINNLPQWHKQQAMDHIDKTITQHSNEPFITDLKSAREILNQHDFDPANWQRFVNFISPRDRIRGNDYRIFLKEPPC